jgi:NADH-quinone oxidoreductase subunit M
VKSPTITSPNLPTSTKREFAILGVLAVATLWMGLYPQPFTEVMHASVNDLLHHVAISKIQ